MINRVAIYHDTSIMDLVKIERRELNAATIVYVSYMLLREHKFSQWRTQEFCSGGGGSKNSFENRGQRKRGSGGVSSLVRGSGGSCNLVQDIPFHKIKVIWLQARCGPEGG